MPKTTSYKNGHELLKARREGMGLSLRQLSVMTGISHTHLMDIERGIKVPSMEKGFLLLKTLSIPMAEYMKAIGYEDIKGVKNRQSPRPRQDVAAFPI